MAILCHRDSVAPDTLKALGGVEALQGFADLKPEDQAKITAAVTPAAAPAAPEVSIVDSSFLSCGKASRHSAVVLYTMLRPMYHWSGLCNICGCSNPAYAPAVSLCGVLLILHRYCCRHLRLHLKLPLLLRSHHQQKWQQLSLQQSQKRRYVTHQHLLVTRSRQQLMRTIEEECFILSGLAFQVETCLCYELQALFQDDNDMLLDPQYITCTAVCCCHRFAHCRMRQLLKLLQQQRQQKRPLPHQ